MTRKEEIKEILDNLSYVIQEFADYQELYDKIKGEDYKGKGPEGEMTFKAVRAYYYDVCDELDEYLEKLRKYADEEEK